MATKKVCACGCGRAVSGNQVWLPGHDHRAIHERIARDHITTVAFIEWYDRIHSKAEKAAATRAQNRTAGRAS